MGSLARRLKGSFPSDKFSAQESLNKKISFCTTCKGRTHHLKETLPKNIRDSLASGKQGVEVEFIVLDYDSDDGLEEWITRDPDMRRYMDDGILLYAKHDNAPYFKHAHAKNMAHILATGDIVCNVDADNFTGQGFAVWLAEQFSKRGDIIVQPSLRHILDYQSSQKKVPGFGGRLALTKDRFLNLGGYREDKSLTGGFGEDLDLAFRAEKCGNRLVPIKERGYLNFIQHSDEDRLCNVEKEDKDKARLIIDAAKARRDLFVTAFRLATLPQANLVQQSFGAGHLIFPYDDRKERIIEDPQVKPCRMSCVRGTWNVLRDRMRFVNELIPASMHP